MLGSPVARILALGLGVVVLVASAGSASVPTPNRKRTRTGARLRRASPLPIFRKRVRGDVLTSNLPAE